MKIVAWGDLHGRSSWKLIAHLERDADVFISMGDEFDSYENFSTAEQMYNFQELLNFKKEQEINGKKVILLIGNHTFHYYPEIGYQGYSGYQSGGAKSIEFLINENREHLQMAYAQDNILFTHAGVSEVWLRNVVVDLEVPEYRANKIADFINEVWKYKPHNFNFCGIWSSTGDEETQTPIWIRPRSLMKSSQNIKKEGIVQVCGHTTQSQIDIEGKATGGKYFFIDTLGTSKEYLIIDDGVFKIGKI